MHSKKGVLIFPNFSTPFSRFGSPSLSVLNTAFGVLQSTTKVGKTHLEMCYKTSATHYRVFCDKSWWPLKHLILMLLHS